MTSIIKTALMTAALLCVSTPSLAQTKAKDKTRDIPNEAELYGDFLAGSYANYLDDAPARKAYYKKAYDQAPDNVLLGRRAITSALTAGDLKLAQSLSKTVNKQKTDEPMARVILGAKAFSEKRYNKASGYFDPVTADLTMQLMMTLMQGWTEYARGNTEKANALFEGINGGPYFKTIGGLQRAKIAAAQGDYEAAYALFDSVEESGFSVIELALSRARAQIDNGQADAALEGLEKLSEASGTFEAGPVKDYIDRLTAGETIETSLTPQQQAAHALTDPALTFFARNRAPDAGEVFLRMALSLDPHHDKAKVWLGSLLDESKRADEAISIFDSVEDGSSYVVSARLAKANILFDRDEDEAGLALLEATNDAHPSLVTRDALGRARLFREKYAEALPIYDAIVKSLTEEELKKDPQPLYFRGICYEREKQWDLAVKDFKRVLSYEPENADALNYLGYTWVDRGENLTEAFDMIRKAVELQPDSGAIIDSLGWAHYKLGQYSEAKQKLEDAVVKSPSSATIIDHLGDVYWKLGRFREAGYQWKRALEYDPTEEERANINAKLKGGLEAAKALP